MDKIFALPIIKPFLRLLNSSKFLVALATVLITYVVGLEPRLEPVAPLLIVGLATLGSILVYAIMREDVATKSLLTTKEAIDNAQPIDKAKSIVKDDVREAVSEAIAEFFKDR